MTNHNYCGPFALSIILGKSYLSCENILKENSMGDVPVSGVWVGSMINALRSQGLKLNMLKADGSYTLSSFKGIKGLYLCEVKGHYVVIRNGIMYDTIHPNGCDPTRHKVLRAYEVIQDHGIL